MQRAPVLALLTSAGLMLSALSCAGEGEGDGLATPSQAGQAVDVARTEQLVQGERLMLLRITRVGRLIATCDHKGRPAVSFVADFLLPTASVTVQTPDHVSNFQIWQIAPFAKVESVTTIWIAMGKSAARPFRCGISAHALTTPERP
jgi:hypothetical protein